MTEEKQGKFDDCKILVIVSSPSEGNAVQSLFAKGTFEVRYSQVSSTCTLQCGDIHGTKVAVALIFNDPLSAAIAAASVLKTFSKLELCINVGVGAAIEESRDGLNLGDVVVSSGRGTIDHESKDSSFSTPSRKLLRAVDIALGARGDSFAQVLKEIIAHTKYARPESHEKPESPEKDAEFRVHLGVVASGFGDLNIEDEQDKSKIAQLVRKGAKVIDNVSLGSTLNEVPYLTIRGIGHYVGKEPLKPSRNKQYPWRNYAAATAAAFLSHLLRVMSTQTLY